MTNFAVYPAIKTAPRNAGFCMFKKVFRKYHFVCRTHAVEGSDENSKKPRSEAVQLQPDATRKGHVRAQNERILREERLRRTGRKPGDVRSLFEPFVLHWRRLFPWKMNLEAGEFVEVLEKVNETWWWVESSEGVVGYVPANHLVENSGCGEKSQWENQEYFSRYGALVTDLP